MSKTNYFITQKNKNSSLDEIATVIVKSFKDEQFFNELQLIQKVKAILRGWKANLNTTKYNAIESPSDAARRLRTIEQKDFEIQYWRNQVKKLDGVNIQKYYEEECKFLKEKGFIK